MLYKDIFKYASLKNVLSSHPSSRSYWRMSSTWEREEKKNYMGHRSFNTGNQNMLS